MVRTRVTLVTAAALAVGLIAAVAHAAPGDTIDLPDSAVPVNADLARCEGGGAAHIAESLSGQPRELGGRDQMVLRFVQLSDTHIIDDDGPGLANGTPTEVILDPAIGNTSATFLNEELTDEVLNAMFKTINACQSEGAKLDLTITTGDITDTNWLNVLRRVIGNIDGQFNQGTTAFEDNCGYTTRTAGGDLKAGAPAECPIPADLLTLPTGKFVGDAEDQSHLTNPAGHGPSVESDFTYQLNTTRAMRQALEAAATATANGSSHIAAGLPASMDNVKLKTPFYAVFGNHDVTVKGTVTYQKPMGAALLGWGRYFFESKRESINEWFKTQPTPGPVGHGFENVDASRWDNTNYLDDSYYSFTRTGKDGRAIRFVVIDTTYDGVDQRIQRDGQTAVDTGGYADGDEVTDPRGLEAGYMSTTQLAWLDGQIKGAASAGQPVLVFSHHPDRTFVERQYPWASVQATAVQLDEVLGQAGSTVVAHIAGHTHANRVLPCPAGACTIAGSGGNPVTAHSFWRFETASLINWPQEGRVVELWKLADGGYALKLTMISPDQNDGAAKRSRELSGYEQMCSVHQMMDKQTPIDACPSPEALELASTTAAGAATDRDVVLMP